MCAGRVRPSGGCYRYKPGKRPANCDELLKKPLALRIIAVTGTKIMPFAIGRGLVCTLTKSNHQNMDSLVQWKEKAAQNSERRSKVN